MRDRIREARATADGFTLIELLIVIVVLGILAGIVVFGVGTFREDSTLAACKADLKTVSVAQDAYNAKNGNPAADVATLVSAGLLKTAPVASEGIEIDATTKEPASTLANCTLA
jgi:prepilin-type N-terminal cleavage/methylation domain-containing protein